MKYLIVLWVVSLFLLPGFVICQDTLHYNPEEIQKIKQINGFIRGGLYAGIDHPSHNKPYVSSAYSDFALQANIEKGVNFKGFGDLRFRYGTEFLKPVNQVDIREAYVKINGKRWDLSLGKKIIKWGRADFTNPASRLSPQDPTSRSPDREDMDLGNLLTDLSWYPYRSVKLEFVAVPCYRSSVLIIEPLNLPQNVTINEIRSLMAGSGMFSYGVKADIHLKNLDWGISWFDGYNPLPGVALTSFKLDLAGQIPVPVTELTVTPYKTRVAGIDFETQKGEIGLRGEAAFSIPYLSYKSNEWIPRPEIDWVGGFDLSLGNWRATGEYSASYVLHFSPSDVEPGLGTQTDYEDLARLSATPGFDPESYVRQQIGAFNRLYNYQLKRYYHSAALRIETDMFYGILKPTVFGMYNFTSRDLLIIPEIKYKPSDGLTVTAGAELYYGPVNSLYYIIKDFMNSVYVSFRVDF